MSMTFATDIVVNSGHTINNSRIFSGTCTTDASVTTKAATCAVFTSSDLVAGATVLVTFTNTNTGAASSLQLNVNSTGAKPIKCITNSTLSNLPAADCILANQTYLFMYDGTNWVTTADSYSKDIYEYDDYDYFPLTGVAGNIYIDKTTNKIYRWGDGEYVAISCSETAITDQEIIGLFE